MPLEDSCARQIQVPGNGRYRIVIFINRDLQLQVVRFAREQVEPEPGKCGVQDSENEPQKKKIERPVTDPGMRTLDMIEGFHSRAGWIRTRTIQGQLLHYYHQMFTNS